MKIDKIASLERKIKRLKKQVESSTEMRNRFQAECVRYKNSLLDTMTRLTEDNRRLKDEVTRGAFRLSELLDKEALSYQQNRELMIDLELAAKDAAQAKNQINFLRDQLDRAKNTPWRRLRDRAVKNWRSWSARDPKVVREMRQW